MAQLKDPVARADLGVARHRQDLESETPEGRTGLVEIAHRVGKMVEGSHGRHFQPKLQVMLRYLIAVLMPGVPTAPRLPHVVIETTLGRIEVEIDTVRAPISGANFLRYVDAKFYDRGSFHRTVTMANQPTNAVKIEVIQAGADTMLHRQNAPIPLERTSVTGLKHLAGTISMARTGPDTARDQFFLCVTDQPELNFGGKRNPDGQGFAAFGRVVAGMDVVRKIQQSPAEGQRLTPPVAVTRIARK